MFTPPIHTLIPTVALGELKNVACCIAAQPRDAHLQQSVTSVSPAAGFPKNLPLYPAEYLTASSHRLRNPATRDVVPTPTLERVANVI